MARKVALEAVRHWAAAGLISVGIESPDDINIIIGMLRDRGVIVNGTLRRLILPESWQTPYDRRMRWLALEPLDASLVDSPGFAVTEHTPWNLSGDSDGYGRVDCGRVSMP